MTATHRNEFTGQAGLDRIQASIRELTAQLNVALRRLDVLERTTGVGVVEVAIANLDRTLSDSDFSKSVFIVTGPQTTARKLTLPSATDATGYQRWIVNATTGGFGLTVGTGNGTNVTVASGATKCVEVAASGARLLT